MIRDVHGLSAWLRAQHAERLAGGASGGACAAALLTAGPAAGKTTLLSQLVALSLDAELVPIVVKVQELQRRMLATPADGLAAAEEEERQAPPSHPLRGPPHPDDERHQPRLPAPQQGPPPS